MRYINTGDIVLIINSDYNPNFIGHAGVVAIAEKFITGTDIYGNHLSGMYVAVDLSGETNRFGTTLWYFKPHYLIKISPDNKEKILYLEQLI